ncbi:sarcosine oxidase subunit gamma [Marinomonas sp. CT5]|uniref:sarcosine oxidase subunit gamma n=1 Tax=Marinomonas sp. CT5 TaxID=2066133 RepID=UPI001BB02D24|nr:sarcosine oxidase subunit gamma family protein [Marinomonas sp. CT5]QUX96270.1 sarcosine oxidase subunit gamma [Marinomonas sp. CT5]
MSDVTLGAMEGKLVTNQLPDATIAGESPLHHSDLATMAKKGPQEGGVYFHERKLMGLLTLRCVPSDEQKSVIESLLGVALPMEPLTSVTTDKVSVRWISPDEWLIIVAGDQAFELESRFQETLPGHYALVNISGGTTIYDVSGSQVVNMLKKSTSVDLYPTEFPVGKVVSTVFAKSSAMICRLADDKFELVVRRSFADYLWLWIQDASREYGLVVKA